MKFDSHDDINHVLLNAPWKLNKDFIILERCLPNKPLTDYQFNNLDLWIQLHGLPINLLNQEDINVLCSDIGSSKAIVCSDPNNWLVFARIKVCFDITKLLPRFHDGILNGITYPIELKYEKFSSFCRCCGRLGHSLKHCQMRMEFLSDLPTDLSEQQKMHILSLLD